MRLSPPPFGPFVFPTVQCSACRCFPCICPSPTERPCACGGTVVAARDDPVEGVRFHNRTPLHVAWRMRHGL